MNITKIKTDLKYMILKECEKEELSIEDIADDIELFSPQSGLDLDSLDTLQISMGIQKLYGIRLVDPKEFRRVVTTIDNLAAYIQKNNA